MGCIDGQQLEWDYDFGHYYPSGGLGLLLVISIVLIALGRV
jgi:hypothetical protein